MQPRWILTLLLALGLGGFALIAAAQSAPAAPTAAGHLRFTPDGTQNPAEIAPQRYVPVELEAVPRYVAATRAAGNACGEAAELPVGDGLIASDSVLTNNFTTDSADPSLASCMWGTPESDRGYRSAWYRFTAPTSGRLVVRTLPNAAFRNDYDTVVAVFGGTCEQPVRLTCNDDANGMLGEVEMFANQGETYYIEVVDRQLSVNGEARLNIEVYIETVSFWQTQGAWNTVTAIRSRHAVVSDGTYLYAVGGQTVVDTTAPVRTASLARFNPGNGNWRELAPMPPQCDPNGYSNTDAAFLGGRIYLPSGYIGDNNLYRGVHCVYDVASDRWSIASPAPWSSGAAVAFAATVARPPSGYFVVGGLNGPYLGGTGSSQALTDVLFYLPGFDTWRTNFAQLTEGRYAHHAALIGDRFLCIAGGLRPQNATETILLANAECLDLILNIWVPIASPNIARFNASGAVGPDGRWYVWGGVTVGTGGLIAVPEVEVYDGVNWTILDRRYNLGAPARAWAEGGFVGRDLYVIGGEAALRPSDGVGGVIGVVERIAIPYRASDLPNKLYMPISGGNNASIATQATRVRLEQAVFGNFNAPGARYDLYTFTLNDARNVIMRLQSIPGGEDYNLFLYDANKLLLAGSNNIGNNNEEIRRALPAGQYFLLVVAEINNPIITGEYRLIVRE